jgi:hypothetical protein
VAQRVARSSERRRHGRRDSGRGSVTGELFRILRRNGAVRSAGDRAQRGNGSEPD